MINNIQLEHLNEKLSLIWMFSDLQIIFVQERELLEIDYVIVMLL